MLFNNDFYGDKKTRWFIGRAVSNRDPAMEGRLQIQIDGIHSPNQADIGPDQLPWAIVMSPSTEGGTSGIGRFSQIQPGALVYGIFLDGVTSQIPMVIGVLNQYENPTPSQPTAVQGEISHNATIVSDQTRAAVRDAINSTSDNTSLNAKRWACMNFFHKDNGLTLKQAAGITGNLEQESTLDPTAINSIGATGLAQWLNVRRDRLLNFSSLRKEKRWDDFILQLEFIMHELRGKPFQNSTREYDGASTEKKAYGDLVQTNNFIGGESNDSSTWVWCVKYERPGADERLIQKREEYALRAYNIYINSLNSGSGVQ